MAGDTADRFTAVLDDGLPVLPDRIEPGQPVAVAVWSGREFGAVTVVEDCEHDPYCAPDQHYVAMTYTYRRRARGWEPAPAAGGTDWPGGTSSTVSLGPRDVLIEGGPAGSTVGWTCTKVEGFVGSDARWIQLVEPPTTTRRAVASSGAFVVVLDGPGPAVVRILDEYDGVIARYEV